MGKKKSCTRTEIVAPWHIRSEQAVGFSTNLESFRSSPNLRRVDFDVLAIRTHSFPLLVSSERLPHIEGVGAIGVVVYYSSVDGVSEAGD